MFPPLDEIEVEKIHDRRNSSNKEEKRMVNVDMNPMVDLAFLLLTFFMLATTFSKPQAMELLVPAKPKLNDIEKEMPVKESKTLSLVLLQNKLIWYNGITEPSIDSVDFNTSSIEDLIEVQTSQIKDLVILIKPLDESEYGNLVTVLDALNSYGAKRYAITTPSEFDQNLSKTTDQNE